MKFNIRAMSIRSPCPQLSNEPSTGSLAQKLKEEIAFEISVNDDKDDDDDNKDNDARH